MNREKGNTLKDVVQACERGTVIKIQIDVLAERCGGREARGEMGNVAMARTSDEIDVAQTFANEIAIVTMTSVPVERCAVVEKIEEKRQKPGRVAEVVARLAASEGAKGGGTFEVIQTEVEIDPKPAEEGIRMAVKAKPFEAIAAGKASSGAVLSQGAGIVVIKGVALPNEAVIDLGALVKDLGHGVHSRHE